MKAYFFEIDEDEGTGVAIVAKNTKDARIIADRVNEVYTYIEMCEHVKLMKNVDVKDLKEGLVDAQLSRIECVRRGFYTWTIDKCPICGNEVELYLQSNGTVCCRNCGAVDDGR